MSLACPSQAQCTFCSASSSHLGVGSHPSTLLFQRGAGASGEQQEREGVGSGFGFGIEIDSVTPSVEVHGERAYLRRGNDARKRHRGKGAEGETIGRTQINATLSRYERRVCGDSCPVPFQCKHSHHRIIWSWYLLQFRRVGLAPSFHPRMERQVGSIGVKRVAPLGSRECTFRYCAAGLRSCSGCITALTSGQPLWEP